ncbi:MAG: family 78 glycoside hydrolase catalytic domain [Rhodothermales bacterium]
MRFIRLLILALSLSFATASAAPALVEGLQTEYMETPLGLDIARPRFSWRMTAQDATRGLMQTAYRVVVHDASGAAMWDSERIGGGISHGIVYAGMPLQPETRYIWTVTVWDNLGGRSTASSWFETGLMNPDIAAWDGATWIGGGDEDLPFQASYFSVYKLDYVVQLDEGARSTRAGLVFGANDSRLMDADKNLFGIENREDESYVAIELDIAGLQQPGGRAALHVYRAGYHPSDSPQTPFKSYDIPLEVISAANAYAPHRVFVECNFGLFMIYIDAVDPAHQITLSDAPTQGGGGPGGNRAALNLNPVGSGNNFISFPMVAEIGFRMPAGQKARFSEVVVRNYREPSNPLFSEDLAASDYSGLFAGEAGLQIAGGAYTVDGGSAGRLITADPSRNAMPMLRTEFDAASKPIARARLYVTARGIYEMYLNGERVGEDYFNPGLTQYNRHHMYQTYDVTDQVSAGNNALGAMLAEGWWSGNITFSGQNWNYFGDRQSLLARLVVTYADGTTDVVTTRPETWSFYNDGPVRYGSFFQGEIYDATREAAVAGWDTPGYAGAGWKPAVEVPLDGTAFQNETLNYDDFALVAQFGENPTIVMQRVAERVNEVRPGVFVYDMGQNMVGFPEIDIVGGTAGQPVTLRYAEVLYPNLPEHGDNVGMIMLENIRAALTQDIHIMKGGDETIRPRFTFHGFRYLEITGIDEALPLTAVRGNVVSSIDRLASIYETSNPKVNRLWQNITWSMRGNFLSIPTDTPARNERMGWSGDISVFARSATYLAHANPFLRRHLLGMRDVQRADGRFTDVAPMGGGFGGTLWGSAGVTVAWEAFQQYGDLDLLAEHFEAVQRYLAFLDTRIDPATGVLNEGPLGDWLSPEGNKNDNTLLWTAYQIFDLELAARMAEALGRDDDAGRYWQRRAERKAHFNATYVDPATHRTIASGFQTRGFGGGAPRAAGDVIDTQVSYAVPLALGVFSEENAPHAARLLAESVMRENVDDSGATRPAYSLMTGFIGTAWISKALSDYGYDEAAYRLLQQTSYPSWLYPVDQGATTIWERLNSYTIENGFGGNNSMNSFNHYSFGAVGAWMYNYSLGIQRDASAPGFRHFILQPTPDPTGAMTWARGHYDAVYGRIESAWERSGTGVTYRFTVPANTTATLRLPAASPQAVSGDLTGARWVGMEADRVVYELAPGAYTFVVR